MPYTSRETRLLPSPVIAVNFTKVPMGGTGFISPAYSILRAMKITLGELRGLIRESFDKEDDWIPEQKMFYSILRNIARKNGGALPVTHESFESNRESITRKGILNKDHGIYFTIGWYDKPAFVTRDAIMVRIAIPEKYLNPLWVVPDDRFGSGDDGYREFMEEFPDCEGGEIGADFQLIPRGWIKEIV